MYSMGSKIAKQQNLPSRNVMQPKHNYESSCFLAGMYFCFNMMGVRIQLYPLGITWVPHPMVEQKYL